VDPPEGTEIITEELPPLPVKPTVCGLPVAESAIISEPVRVPFAVGVNVTVTVHEPPAGIPPSVLQLPEFATAKSPLAVKLVKLTVTVPVFVTVTLCAGLVVFSACRANVKLVGAIVTVDPEPVAVPVSVTVCGLPVALSAIVSAPVSTPVARGAKFTLMLQVAAGAKLVVASHAPVAPIKPKFADTPTLVRLTVVVPVFVTTTFCDGLVVPTAWLGNVSAVGAIVIVPLALVPVPLNVTVCGLFAAVSVIVTAPLYAVAVVGVNVTLMVQVAAGLIWFPVHVFVSVKPEVTTTLGTLKIAEPVFVSVIVCTALVVFIAWLPKLKLDGAIPTVAVTPPVSPIVCVP